MTSAFISYSHQDQELVRSVAEHLQADGFHVWLDEWDLKVGDSLIERISEAIDQVDFVVAFISNASRDSQWCRKEVSLAMTGELAAKGVKVLPVRIEGAQMPPTLVDKFFLDATGLDAMGIKERLARDMAAHISPSRIIPTRRTKPQPAVPSKAEDGPIRIVGIDAQGITAPRNDGTPGSALYRVPVLLSRRPDSTWGQLMVQNWDRPPQFSTMHRPGIGSVSGNAFVLNGTTLEEVERYHLDTLQLAVEETNKQYDEIMRRHKARADAEAEARRKHEMSLASALDRLATRFDSSSSDS